MIGVEIVKDRASSEPAPELRERILEEAFRRGLLLLGCGKNTIRHGSPPLIIDREDAEIAAGILAEAVACRGALRLGPTRGRVLGCRGSRKVGVDPGPGLGLHRLPRSRPKRRGSGPGSCASPPSA